MYPSNIFYFKKNFSLVSVGLNFLNLKTEPQRR